MIAKTIAQRSRIKMESAQMIVTFSGLALACFVIWFFFFPSKKGTRVGNAASGLQEVNIRVKGGYDPDVIFVRAGSPVRLNFYREETADCSERVIFPTFKKSAVLTPFTTVSVELMPEEAGEFDFTCGMGMLHGKLIVE